jgi:hypothetical protein
MNVMQILMLWNVNACLTPRGVTSSGKNKGPTNILSQTRIDGPRFRARRRTTASYRGERWFTAAARPFRQTMTSETKIKRWVSIKTLPRTRPRWWLRRRRPVQSWPRARWRGAAAHRADKAASGRHRRSTQPNPHAHGKGDVKVSPDYELIEIKSERGAN